MTSYNNCSQTRFIITEFSQFAINSSESGSVVQKTKLQRTEHLKHVALKPVSFHPSLSPSLLVKCSVSNQIETGSIRENT